MKGATLLLSFTPLVFAGCPGQLDAAKLEKEIAATIEDKTGAEVESVTCPKERTLKKGDEFTCKVDFEGGGDAKVAAEQTSDTGDVSFKLKGAVIVPKRLEKKISKGLEEQGFSNIKVDCGKKVRMAKEDDTFTCKATDPQGVTRTLAVTVTDDDGNIAWKVE
jgi:hypothetical protein